MDSNRRNALKIIGTTAVAGTGIPAAASATTTEEIPEPINTKKVEEQEGEQVFRVEFENEYVFVRIVSNDGVSAAKEVAAADGTISHGKAYANKVPKNGDVERLDAMEVASDGAEIIEELIEIRRTGPSCNYVGSGWSDYRHQLNGISVKFTRTASGIGRTLLTGGVSAALAAAGIVWQVSVPVVVLVGIYLVLSGPYYYYGEMDRDRGCIAGRCGFRTFQGRAGDGSVRSPSWSQFRSLTDSEGSLPIHIGSP